MRASLTVLLVAAVCAALLYASAGPAPRAAPERLVIAVGRQPLSSLLYIAADRGYFAEEGVDVVLQSHPHGKSALWEMMVNRADLATSAEMPFIAALRGGEPIVAIATIESSDKQNFIVARRDRGIERPRDLIGRRVAVIPGTSSEIFLDAFLLMYAIPKSKLDIHSASSETIQSTLSDGSVDAVSVWALDAALLNAKLGSLARVFVEEGLYTQTWALIGRRDVTLQKQARIEKALRALMRAEDFAMQDPHQAVAIVARRLAVQPKLLAGIWPNFNFSVGLHQYLLVNLETHARLTRKNEFERELNFSSALMLQPLRAIDASRVTAVH